MYTYLSQHTYSLVAFSCFCIYYFLRCVIQLFVIPCESSWWRWRDEENMCWHMEGVRCTASATWTHSDSQKDIAQSVFGLRFCKYTMHPASTTILVKKEIQFYRWPQEMVYQGPSDGSWVTVGDQWIASVTKTSSKWESTRLLQYSRSIIVQCHKGESLYFHSFCT